MYKDGEQVRYTGDKFNEYIPKGTIGYISYKVYTERDKYVYYVKFKNKKQLWCKENEIESIVERKKQMNENYLMLNGKRVDLTEEQIEKLGLKTENKDYFKRTFNDDDDFLHITSCGEVRSFDEEYTNMPVDYYNVGNYCTDKELLQQRALHETLSRLLWRFSMQNDGDKIDWNVDWNGCRKDKYHIVYDCSNKKFKIFSCQTMQIGEVTWFFSYEIAQRAIDEIVLPFMKEHPEFVW